MGESVHDRDEREARRAAIEAELLGPGGPFELAEETVLGERVRVFARRAPSLRAFLDASLAFGEREYLVFGERRLGFAEHHALADRVAGALHRRFGVGKGDRVAILAANCVEWVVTFWAAMRLGAIAVPLNGWWVGNELAFALADAQPRVLLGDEKRLARLASDPGMPVVSFERDFARIASETGPPPQPPIDEDDPAVLLYSSGTTGRPKGALLTHRNIVALVGIQSFHGARLMRLAGAPAGFVPPPPTLLSANPLFHVSGLSSGAIAHLAIGAKSVWLVGRFDPAAALSVIEKERVTGWAPHGSMAYQVINHPERDRYDLSSVRSLGSGGAPVPAAIQRGLRELFPNAHAAMGIGYGLTEATGLATIHYGDELAEDPDSVGRPLPTVELTIRDASGALLPDGEEGEIWLRGPLVMRCYWNRPDATEAALAPGRWLRTADIGRVVKGRLTVAARRRDLILRAAENVYPAEIEARLAQHPSVEEAAVVGVPSAEHGQEVKAFVVLREDRTATPDELARFCAETLAYFKVPAHWELRREPLPRNASGKVMKYVLSGEGESAGETSGVRDSLS